MHTYCRYTFILILLLIPSVATLAQNPKKLEKLKQKDKYEKIISLTEKQIRKGKATSETWYFHIGGLLMKARNTEGRTREKSYNEATRAFKRLNRVENGDSLKAHYRAEMIEVGMLVFNQIPESGKSKRKYYAGFFADYCGDTLEVYYTYFAGGTENGVAEAEEEANKVPIETLDKHKSDISYSVPTVVPKRETIIHKAEEVIGTPWVYAGLTPGKGFDCSGFVIWTYGELGYEFPHSTKMLAQIGTPVSLKEAKPGDLVCFGSKAWQPNSVYHVALVHSREGEKVYMIHCGTSNGVCIVPLTSGYWSEVGYFIVRIME